MYLGMRERRGQWPGGKQGCAVALNDLQFDALAQLRCRLSRTSRARSGAHGAFLRRAQSRTVTGRAGSTAVAVRLFTMIDTTEIDKLFALARRAVVASRPTSIAGFQTDLVIDDKAPEGGVDFDPVTEADRQCEQIIRDVLLEGAPHIAFLGEESASSSDSGSAGGSAAGGGAGGGAVSDAHGKGLCWVVDPIDGTRAYIAGIPVWSCLIALCKDGIPLFGIADFPALDECYIGVSDQASVERAGRVARLHTRGDVSLSDALMCCTTPDMFTELRQQRAFAAVRQKLRMTRFGTDAYGYAMLAAGRVDVVIEADLALWDVAAVSALVRSAGGVVTDWSGNEPGESGEILACAHSQLHARLLGELAVFL